MTTKRLVLDLIAFALATAFLFSFVPWALNATDTLTNVLGIGVCAFVVIGVIAFVHSKFTSNKERSDEA